MFTFPSGNVTPVSLLGILADDQSMVSYRPKLNKITGSVIATILVQHTLHLAQKNGWKPFFKFKRPCQHADYEPGTSWEEELGITQYEFDGAMSKIAYKKGTEQNGRPIEFWTTIDRRTFYRVDVERMTEMIASAYSQEGDQFTYLEKTRLGKSDEIPAESDSKNDEKRLSNEQSTVNGNFPITYLENSRLEYKLNNITNNSSEESIGSCIGVTSNCIGVVGRRPLDKNENHCITDEEGDLALSEDIEAKQRELGILQGKGNTISKDKMAVILRNKQNHRGCKGLNAMDKARVAIRFFSELTGKNITADDSYISRIKECFSAGYSIEQILHAVWNTKHSKFAQEHIPANYLRWLTDRKDFYKRLAEDKNKQDPIVTALEVWEPGSGDLTPPDKHSQAVLEEYGTFFDVLPKAHVAKNNSGGTKRVTEEVPDEDFIRRQNEMLAQFVRDAEEADNGTA